MPTIQVGGHRGGSRAVAPVLAEIDEEDMELVSKYQWSKNTGSSQHTTYAISITGGKKQHMHRLIMGLGDYKDDKRIVNHIDGNGLNNKKSNLEICDTLYNSQSFRRHHGSIGCVYLDTSMQRVKRWKVVFVVNKTRQQKRFETELEAREWLGDLAKKAGY
jgi:hypothetical protein